MLRFAKIILFASTHISRLTSLSLILKILNQSNHNLLTFLNRPNTTIRDCQKTIHFKFLPHRHILPFSWKLLDKFDHKLVLVKVHERLNTAEWKLFDDFLAQTVSALVYFCLDLFDIFDTFGVLGFFILKTGVEGFKICDVLFGLFSLWSMNKLKKYLFNLEIILIAL